MQALGPPMPRRCACGVPAWGDPLAPAVRTMLCCAHSIAGAESTALSGNPSVAICSDCSQWFLALKERHARLLLQRETAGSHASQVPRYLAFCRCLMAGRRMTTAPKTPFVAASCGAAVACAAAAAATTATATAAAAAAATSAAAAASAAPAEILPWGLSPARTAPRAPDGILWTTAAAAAAAALAALALALLCSPGPLRAVPSAAAGALRMAGAAEAAVLSARGTAAAVGRTAAGRRVEAWVTARPRLGQMALCGRARAKSAGPGHPHQRRACASHVLACIREETCCSAHGLRPVCSGERLKQGGR